MILHRPGKSISWFVGFLLFALILSGCSGSQGGNTSQLQQENTALQQKITALEAQISASQANIQSSPLLLAMEAVQLIGAQDFDGLTPYVHPSKGVRFSPYTFVDTAQDLSFTASQFAGLMSSSNVYNWGSFDGSGDPINFTFAQYYNRFIYDQDFANPHMIGNNVVIGQGNSLNNITSAYPAGQFVEFHFTGFDPQYEGMDWRSLRLVMEQNAGLWFLVGIIHDEWTI